MVSVNEFVIGQRQIATEENDMSPFLRREIGLDDDDHVYAVGKGLVEHGSLIDIGLDAIVSGGLHQVFGRNVVILSSSRFGVEEPCRTFRESRLLVE